MPNYIAYLRVSTQKQGYSGLGLEAQRQLIQSYLKGQPILAEYVEVESGRHKDRAQLKAALAHCKREGAGLVVAKLDRLARNVSFLAQLLDSDTEIVFCDFPQANKMVLHILGAIAQYEAELTATRTRQALAAKKARGYSLGNPEHLLDKHQEAIQHSIETNKAKALSNPHNKRAIAILTAMKGQNKTYQEMADALNEQGFQTSTGKAFSPALVYQFIKRYKI